MRSARRPAAAGILALAALAAACGGGSRPAAVGASTTTAAPNTTPTTVAPTTTTTNPTVGSTQTATTAGPADGPGTIAITLVQVFDPATLSEGLVPPAGTRYVAIEIRIQNLGQAPFSMQDVYGDLAVVDAPGQRYSPQNYPLTECQGFQAPMTLPPSQATLGCAPFALSTAAQVQYFNFSPDLGYDNTTLQWRLP